VVLRVADCERVLVTGKYINTIRDSGELGVCELEAPIEYHDHAAYYTRIVSRAHAYVSRLVLQTLRQRSSLVDRLNAACHFFLLRRGDAVTRLLALAEDELAKRVGAASRVRLASMLGVALRDGGDGAASGAMRFEDDVSCELLPYNLPQQLLRILHVSASGGVSLMGDALQLEAREAAILGSASKKRAVEHAALQSPDVKALTAERVAFDSDVLQAMSGLTAIEAFSLTFAVPWPASLVLSRDALCKYQLLFRHTFLCKHVERQLAQAWSALNGVARAFRQPREIGAALLRASLVRQRMAHYVHELLVLCDRRGARSQRARVADGAGGRRDRRRRAAQPPRVSRPLPAPVHADRSQFGEACDAHAEDERRVQRVREQMRGARRRQRRRRD
jgi:gamma-tubulin complex component 2